MEVNMSPNLTPAHERYEINAIIYEQLIYNTVRMVGGGSYFEFMSRYAIIFNFNARVINSNKIIFTDLMIQIL